jgi:hypothetical protein
MPFVIPEDPALLSSVITCVPVMTPRNFVGVESGSLTPNEARGVLTDQEDTAAASTVLREVDTAYVTNVNITEEQNFITTVEGGGELCIGTLDSGLNYTNISCNVTRLGFDSACGFQIEDLGNGLSKIAINAGIDLDQYDSLAIGGGLTANTGFNNLAIGKNAGLSNTLGQTNVYLGCNAGSLITTGSQNTVIGSLAGTAGLTCTVLIGAGTCERIKVDNTGLYINGASYNVNNVLLNAYCSLAIGGGLCNTTGTYPSGFFNYAIGFKAGYCNTTGSDNVIIGTCAGYYSDTYSSVMIGSYAGECNTAGAYNVFIGFESGKKNTTGGSNTFVGNGTGFCNNGAYGNTFIGSLAGLNATTGLCNTFVGFLSGCAVTTGTDNTIIGALTGTPGLTCTVLIGAGCCERIKVDNTGLSINGGGVGAAITLRNMYETVVSLSGATGIVVHDFSQGSIFDHTGILGNFTANITNLNLSSGFVTNVVLILNQDSTPYIPTAIQIDGAAQTIRWVYAAQPVGTANSKDIVNFSITNIGGTYTVFGQLVNYG